MPYSASVPVNSPLRSGGEDKGHINPGDTNSTEPSLSTTPALLNPRPPPTAISNVTSGSSGHRQGSLQTSLDSSERSTSRRRFGVSSIFKGKRSSQDEVESIPNGGPSAPNGGTESRPLAGSLNSSYSSGPMVSSPPSSSSAQFGPPPSAPTASTSRLSKPPVSLFQNIRNRRSSSIDRLERPGVLMGGSRSSRQSSEEPRSIGSGSSRRGSGQDEGFLGARGSPASTVMTTPEVSPALAVPARLASLAQGEESPRVQAEAPILPLDIGGGENLEDMCSFVNATSPVLGSSPTSVSTSPFVRSDGFSSRRASVPTTSSPSTSTPAPTSPPALGPDSPPLSDNSNSSAEARQPPRRATLNIGGLSLPGIARLSPPPSNSSTPSPQHHVPANAPSLSGTGLTVDTTSGGASMTRPTRQQRMNTLPRLLSSPGYERAGPRTVEGVMSESEDGEGEEAGGDAGDETESSSGESETETENEPDEQQRVQQNVPTPSTARNPVATPRPGVSTSRSMRSLTSGWVTFDPLTPTPGAALATSRPPTSGDRAQAQSYFDLPTQSRAATAKTPTPMTPLVPMSRADVARGKRPTRHDERRPVPSGASATSALTPVPRRREASSPAEGTTPEVAEPKANGLSLSLGGLTEYRRRAQSAADLLSPGLHGDSDENPLSQAGTAAVAGLDPVWQTPGTKTPGPSFLQSTPGGLSAIVPPTPKEEAPGSPTVSKLQRRMSMYELHQPAEPPVYHVLYDRPGKPQEVYPREEEGAEGLPDYTCAIHFEGYLPRKMEFTAPSVQAKDRAWKRQYVVLHGTSIKVFKYDLRTHPIPGEDDWSQVSGAKAAGTVAAPVHFHEGEYGAEAEAQGGSRFPLSVADAKAKAIEKLHTATANANGGNQLVRHYSLQNAESGLAADYIKRKHVVRVRAEGEQFLLQTKDDRGVISLIEALQAATNIALDLDARPLPKFITLPRRRRRRRRVAAADGAAVAGAAAGTAGSEEGAATATAAAASEGRRRPSANAESRLDEMLAQEQSEFAAAGARG